MGLQPPKGEFSSPENYKEQLNIFAKNNKDIEIVYEMCLLGYLSHATWHGLQNITQDHRRVIVSHCIPSNAKFHPTNEGGMAKIYKKYKNKDSDILDEKFFPLLWKNN